MQATGSVRPAGVFALSMSARAIRKRERKAALRRLAADRKFDRTAIIQPSIVRTELTDRELAILRKQTDALFETGKIDIRYMGVRFLELHRQGWTPPFIEHFGEATGMIGEDLSKWTDEQFEQVWEWWRHLHPVRRDEVMHESRELSKP